MKRYTLVCFTFLLLVSSLSSWSQAVKDSLLQQASLEDCIQYAFKHQPALQQSLLDEQITERQIQGRLADWYPQVGLNYNYQYNFQLTPAYFNGTVVKTGTTDASTLGLSATQNIFNRDALLASRTAGDVRKQYKQATSETKIDLVVNVSKAFYDVLLSLKQIELLNDDIDRLKGSLKNARDQYEGGIVDKTDYKRATISLNNSLAEKKTAEETLKERYVYLKQQMGYTSGNDIVLLYDSVRLATEIFIDTSAAVKYDNRIEFQLLQTRKRLQAADLQYNRWSYLPTVSAFGAYNVGGFLSNSFGQLYNNNYPNSYAGLQLTFPIFQGGKRVQNIRAAELQVKRIDWDIVALQTSINSEYAQAMAAYKSNLNEYIVLKDNLALAQEVYDIIQTQYKAGIKTYLDVIIAESDLRTSQVNYANALYQLLSSKLDVQKALGDIHY
ncbi:MAG TPA: TolC family protein [Chitinophagaceae bacterium]|jgi:outer membrane protein TolC